MWTLPKAGGRLRSGVAIVTGALLGAMAVAVLVDPNEDPYLGWAFLLVAVTCVLAAEVMRIGHRRGALILGPVREGSKHSGVTFPNRRASVFAVPGVMMAMGSAGIMLSLSTDPGAGGNPILLLCGLFMLVAGPLVGWLRWRDKGYVLTEKAILLTQRGKTRVIPWEAVLGVVPWEQGKGALVIKLLLKEGAWRVPRLPFRSRTGPILWVSRQVNDPALLLHTLAHYLTTPENRHELATTAALERLTRGELPSVGEGGVVVV
ncbi:hypothetical protein GWI34_04175 [Actinomadura sp. DSM 109109]|nr:hypothetical protein [Actinomadura lepetitiana]